MATEILVALFAFSMFFSFFKVGRLVGYTAGYAAGWAAKAKEARDEHR